MLLKDSIANQQVRRGRGRPPKVNAKGPQKGQPLTLTPGDYRRRIVLTAQQYMDEEAKRHAVFAGELVRGTIQDMSLIITTLRDMIPFSDQKALKDIAETYRTCVTEVRRALGLADSVESTGPRTLVSIQCVGEVTVQSPEGQSGMRPLPAMPDLSHLLPPKSS